jgi:SOS-response transcriptional repressor LexA
MSVDALTWAKKQKTGSPAKKCLLMMLADYADEDGCCWPSQETLARVTEQSIDSVQRQLKQLEDDGLVRRRGRGVRNGRRAVTIYALPMAPDIVQLATTPQSAAPQIAASRITTPQTTPNDTAQLCGKNRQLEPSESVAADARAREPSKSLISSEAHELADELLRLQHLDPDDPRAVGAAYQAQTWLTKGWRPDLIMLGVQRLMTRRSTPPRSLRYFEEAIAEIHAEQERPLPVAIAASAKVLQMPQRSAPSDWQGRRDEWHAARAELRERIIP